MDAFKFKVICVVLFYSVFSSFATAQHGSVKADLLFSNTSLASMNFSLQEQQISMKYPKAVNNIKPHMTPMFMKSFITDSTRHQNKGVERLIQETVNNHNSKNLLKSLKSLISYESPVLMNPTSIFEMGIPLEHLHAPNSYLMKPVRTSESYNLLKPVRIHQSQNLLKPVRTHESHSLLKPVRTHESHSLLKPVRTHESHSLLKPVRTHESHSLLESVKTHESHSLIEPVRTHESHSLLKPVRTHESHSLLKPVRTHESHSLLKPVRIHESTAIVNLTNTVPNSSLEFMAGNEFSILEEASSKNSILKLSTTTWLQNSSEKATSERPHIFQGQSVIPAQHESLYENDELHDYVSFTLSVEPLKQNDFSASLEIEPEKFNSLITSTEQFVPISASRDEQQEHCSSSVTMEQHDFDFPSSTENPQNVSIVPLTDEQLWQAFLASTNTSHQLGPEVCGISRNSTVARIMGGHTSSFMKWPWMISLARQEDGELWHRCGAVLVNKLWALTAAHCVVNKKPSDIVLRLGEHNKLETHELYPYVDMAVFLVLVHPKFNQDNYENDIALLRFDSHIPVQKNILPVCLPNGSFLLENKTGVATGWGRLSEDGELPTNLHEAHLPIINNFDCENMYLEAGYIEHIPDMFFCAGFPSGGLDACEGDSGGPMVVRGDDGHWYLAGLISWGMGCGEPNQPGVYTRVSKYIDWIKEIILI